MRRIFLVPYTFVLMNCAAVMGFYWFARGNRDPWNSIWRKPPTPRLGSPLDLVWR